MAGAPSHVDTFDFKNTPGVTPAAAAPQTVNGILWPTGILPKLGAMTNQFSLVRSVQAHALVHTLGQTWVQIGRNPAASLGNIAPNIGSIVALQKAPERQPGHVLPTFLALNSDGAVSSGYLDATYAPFKVDPTAAGLPNTTNALGQTRWQEMYTQMHAEDDVLRVDSPLGQPVVDMDTLYSSGHGPDVRPDGGERVHVFLGRFDALRRQLFRQRSDRREAGAGGESGDAIYPGDAGRLGHARRSLRCGGE